MTGGLTRREGWRQSRGQDHMGARGDEWNSAATCLGTQEAPRIPQELQEGPSPGGSGGQLGPLTT